MLTACLKKSSWGFLSSLFVESLSYHSVLLKLTEIVLLLVSQNNTSEVIFPFRSYGIESTLY